MDWAKERRASFLKPDSAETVFVAGIFRVPHFLTLVGETQRLQGSTVADPFIIACAKVREGCVVIGEAHRPHAAKIPNVCQHFGVDCTNVEGFLDRLDWHF